MTIAELVGFLEAYPYRGRKRDIANSFIQSLLRERYPMVPIKFIGLNESSLIATSVSNGLMTHLHRNPDELIIAQHGYKCCL